LDAVVSDLEIERKESLSRQEAAKRLMVIAEAVAGGEEVELDLGGTSLSLRVADDVRIEVEVEVDGDEYELELGMVTSVRCLAGAAGPTPSAGTRPSHSNRRSALSGFPASHTTSMTSHHAQPEPNQRSDQCRREGEQPQRPCEAPEQESEGHVLAILDHEDGQQSDSGKRGDRSAAEPTPFRGTISAGARCLGTRGAGAWWLLDHDPSPM
jgi:amphi-Trp domain-containing protein